MPVFKRYFQQTRLADIIASYPMQRKGLARREVERERERRRLFVDFLGGLLDTVPHKRWTARQASAHPFITHSSSSLNAPPASKSGHAETPATTPAGSQGSGAEPPAAPHDPLRDWVPPPDPKAIDRRLNYAWQQQQQQQRRHSASQGLASQQLKPASPYSAQGLHGSPGLRARAGAPAAAQPPLYAGAPPPGGPPLLPRRRRVPLDASRRDAAAGAAASWSGRAHGYLPDGHGHAAPFGAAGVGPYPELHSSSHGAANGGYGFASGVGPGHAPPPGATIGYSSMAPPPHEGAWPMPPPGGPAGAHPSSYAGPGMAHAGGVPQPMPDLAYALQRPEPPGLSLSYSSPSNIAMLQAQAGGGPGGPMGGPMLAPGAAAHPAMAHGAPGGGGTPTGLLPPGAMHPGAAGGAHFVSYGTATPGPTPATRPAPRRRTPPCRRTSTRTTRRRRGAEARPTRSG